MTLSATCYSCGCVLPNHSPTCSAIGGLTWNANAPAPCEECSFPFGFGHATGCSKAQYPSHPWGPIGPAPHAPAPVQFIPIGWQCPGCRACFSPTQMVCMYCRPQVFTTTTMPPVGTGG